LLQDANLGARRPVGAASSIQETGSARGLLVYTTTQQKSAFSNLQSSSRFEQNLSMTSDRLTPPATGMVPQQYRLMMPRRYLRLRCDKPAQQ
jgi:hypothetical protein